MATSTDPARDRGSALPFVVLVVLLAVLACLGLARYGRGAADAARARTAADAAALAGVEGGRLAASETARANGGSLVDYAAGPDGVTVQVRVGDRTARARALHSPRGS